MILSSLVEYYNELDGIVPRYGYSQERISFALALNAEGELVDEPIDLRELDGKKLFPKLLIVPQGVKRTRNTTPCFLWGNSSYVLGVSAIVSDKTSEKNQKFKEEHQKWLSNAKAPELNAVLNFINKWTPDQLERFSPNVREGILDSNIVFKIDGDLQHAHDVAEAKEICALLLTKDDSREIQCLVSGQLGPLARLHPSIKGVNDAQSSGASIVSFNQESFTSYGKKQGENSQISQFSAFAYTTMLNYLLRRSKDNQQKIQVGDATVVFWAIAEKRACAQAAEITFADLLGPIGGTDVQETNKLHNVLKCIAQGRPLSTINPNLDANTKLYVLGLSPNASRLSIRFWHTGSLDYFAKVLAQHYQDLELDPLPWQREPSVSYLARITAPSYKDAKGKPNHKVENISPLLAGELLKSVLTGCRYPRSLLSHILMRFRSDGEISGVRIALCKAVLVRDKRLGFNENKEEISVSLDEKNIDPAYLLGRLFSVMENIQRVALGPDISATIRDRYYGAASTTPARVYPFILVATQHHLSKINKEKSGLALYFQDSIARIMDGLNASFPRCLNIEAQGRFAIGYYHQCADRFKPKSEKIDLGIECEL